MHVYLTKWRMARGLRWQKAHPDPAPFARELVKGIVAEWGTDGDQALVKPTHWRPLPLPPNVQGQGDGQA